MLDDVMAAVFPETVGCLENHHGDVLVPEHPLVRQTLGDCLNQVMDIDGLESLLRKIESAEGRIETRDLPQPGAGEALVAPEAWGVNFVDVLMIAGGYQLRPEWPFVPGMDSTYL